MSALTRPVTLLLSGLLLLTVCIAVLNTLVPLWLSHEQYSLWHAGLVTSAFFTGNLGGTLLAAPAIRRWGFNRTYYLATAIFAVATFALYVSHSFIGWSLWRFLAGCGCALIWLVVESALLCSGTLKNRGRMLAAYMIVYYLGTVLGQLFISYLSVTFSEVIPVLLALMAVAILPMIFFRGQGSEEPAPGIIRLLLRRHSRLGINGCIISGIVLGSLYGLLPLWLAHRGWSDSSVGYWMALLISAGIISQWPIGRLADRFGRLLVLRVQVFVVMLGSLAMLTGASMPVVLFILGSSGFTLYPVAMTWACECVPRHELITMNQVLLLSYTIGSLAGPALASFLMERWSDNMLFAMIAGVAMIYLMMLLRKGNHQATPVAHA